MNENFSLKILIIEDDPYYSLELTTLIQTIGYQVATVSSDHEATLSAITTHSPDLIIIDITSKGKDQILEAAKQQLEKNIQILFITCLKKEDFYSDKKQPELFNEISLRKSITQAIYTIAPTKNSSKSGTFLAKGVLYFIKKGVFFKVKIEDILYIKAKGDYANIHTSKGEVTILLRFKQVEQLLHKSHFIQTHRSYLINQAKVLAVDTENNNFLVGDEMIPISRQLKKKVLEQFDNYCSLMRKNGKRLLVSGHSLVFI